ncbi:MAG: hypothetical protein L0154_01190 [Chloroflexi bacterium]|nr:hypothetical protein [Chloroflexota bacterium]
MRHILLQGIRLSGLILLILVSTQSIYRRNSSSAYWIFASEQPHSATLFDSHKILDSNFHPHHGSSAQGEFIQWSPDGEYYFVRFEGLFSGPQPGLYRFHTATGQSEFLLPTASIPNSLDMELSPDKDTFLVTTPTYREGRGGLYVMDTHGNLIFRIDEDIQIGVAEWSVDGQWVEFIMQRTAEWPYYHVHPDGSQLEQTDAPRNSLIDLGDDFTIIGKMGTTHENLPDDQRYSIHRSLPNNWLIVKATIVSAGTLRTAPVLYRMSRDTSDLSLIFEDNLGRDPDVIDWDANGNVLYVAAQGDTNSLFRVNMVSSDRQMLIEDYQPVRTNCFDDSTKVCPPVYLDVNFEWVIWRTTNNTPAYNITSIQSGETNDLFRSDYPVSQEISMISPDKRWLYVSYVDLQSRDCVTKRISIDDRRVETNNEACLVALSPVIDLPAHMSAWFFIGMMGLSLSFAWFFYWQQMTDFRMWR